MRLFAALLLFAATTLPLFAQSDTIKPSPSAVEMRRVWLLKGASQSRAGVGNGAGSVGDIDGDGIAEIAIRTGRPWRWSLYKGGIGAPETTPFWTFDSGTGRRPLVGDFWGTGRKAVGFSRQWDIYGIHISMHIYRTDSGVPGDTATLIWHSVPQTNVTQWPLGLEFHAADLDQDGDEELIVTMHGMGFGNGGDYHGQIWIYAGGPDFQLDTPTVVIRDDRINAYAFGLHVLQLDDDAVPDLLVVGRYDENQTTVTRMGMHFGRRGSLPQTGGVPDRELLLGASLYLDVDGDGMADILNGGTVSLFLSGSGKSARTRAFDNTDVDAYITSGSGELQTAALGYLNSKRYAMLGGLLGFGLVGFSGAPDGPDPLWDGFSGGGGGLSGSPFQFIQPIADCTGDGWDDVLVSSYSYNYDDGIALVLAGGPYIPSEDPTVSVHMLPLEGKTNALALWPNPVRERLNIAWRGDLARMPRRFEIHDITGRLVASGAVPDGDGAAVWQCDGHAPGVYILSVFDQQGQLPASQRFVRQ